MSPAAPGLSASQVCVCVLPCGFQRKAENGAKRQAKRCLLSRLYTGMSAPPEQVSWLTPRWREARVRSLVVRELPVILLRVFSSEMKVCLPSMVLG